MLRSDGCILANSICIWSVCVLVHVYLFKPSLSHVTWICGPMHSCGLSHVIWVCISIHVHSPMLLGLDLTCKWRR